MHLKSLTIKGFKTFADKEDIIFDSSTGITAIVGPNGCGKSNVVDSFRFVLGESNIRGLRVNSVPEVIFAGTQTRKQMSMAEVSLIFDNTDKTLPLDYTEVSVKRRVFRDGESDFLINNQSGRLKDIRDLFLDSGLSTESFSIISQGKVDSILSSKPEERRSVFEEVAGINKYKFRKIEAERKLILSEQNLLRISDLKVEIGEQLISLEAQAKVAKEYKEMQENLKTQELATFKKQMKLLLERKETLKKELDNIHALVSQKEEQKRKAREERAQKQGKLSEVNREIESLSADLQKAKDSIEEEKSNLILKKERFLFEEKGKLRDLKEEERFISFEIKRLEDNLKSLALKKDELQNKSRDIATGNLDEFGDFKDVLKTTIELSKILKTILVDYFGKSVEELKEDPSAEKFRQLVEIESTKIEKDIESQKKELASKNDQLKNLSLNIASAEKNLEELVRQTEEFEKSPSDEIISKMLQSKEMLEKKIVSFRGEKEKIYSELKTLEESFSFDELNSDQNSEVLQKEIAFAKVESEISQIENQVKAEYFIGVEELLNFSHEAQNINKNKKDIEALRAYLRSMEPVNLLAIDEFEKCKERHAFIETQHQDILMARENLKTLICELDSKAREDFLKSIGVVAKNFSEVFSELFEGGEAQIEMEKDKDALEAGIEISVRPNGRKWLSLSLLSGGERSLTAIALLFAILKTSPTPLCVLDEVDAALDDANIGRFASFLKKFAQTSQILVITHSKRTMAVADTIYGVTMEEPGISKVVSMKLTQAA